MFEPAEQAEEAVEFFKEFGFVVLRNCLSNAELSHLNGFFDRTQKERPLSWRLSENRKPHRGRGLIFSQPLLDYPELDKYTRHPRSFKIVGSLLGGGEYARFSEFNFREMPPGAGPGGMNFHHDAVTEDRFTRAPYYPADWVGTIHYLTDTTSTGAPCFCVVRAKLWFDMQYGLT
jgi:hypothetical protein